MSRTCDTDIPGFWVNVHQVCHNRDLALNAVSDLADATFSGRREMWWFFDLFINILLWLILVFLVNE